jgi:hypothetical protein
LREAYYPQRSISLLLTSKNPEETDFWVGIDGNYRVIPLLSYGKVLLARVNLGGTKMEK